jgi:NodT family efflux transporter outer membrane factor (OMF) lipoprotein
MSSVYRLTVVTLAAVGVAACAPLTTVDLPAPDRDPILAQTAVAWSAGEATGSDAIDWARLGDPAVTALVQRVLAANPTLSAARAHASAAAAIAAGTRSTLGPQAGVRVDAGREQISANGMFPKPFGGQTFSLIEVASSLTYRLDLSGIAHAHASAARAQSEAAAEDAERLSETLSAAAARLYYGLAGALADREVLLRQQAVVERGRVLDATRARTGLETATVAHRSAAAAESFREQLIQVDEAIARTRQMLAVLVGQGPDAWRDYTPTRLSAQPSLPLPQDLRVGLLGRRPDVRAARRRAEAAAYDRSAAQRAYVPDLDFSALLGLQSRAGDTLFGTGSREWSVLPALSLPIFDGGLRHAAITAQQAQYDAARADYERVVLSAVDDVSRALTGRVATAQALAAATTAGAEEAAAAAAIERRVGAGISPEAEWLAAQSRVIERDREVVRLTARARSLDVDLIEALGGTPREENQR